MITQRVTRRLTGIVELACGVACLASLTAASDARACLYEVEVRSAPDGFETVRGPVPSNTQLWARAYPYGYDTPYVPTFSAATLEPPDTDATGSEAPWSVGPFAELSAVPVGNGLFRAEAPGPGIFTWRYGYEDELNGFYASGERPIEITVDPDVEPPYFFAGRQEIPGQIVDYYWYPEDPGSALLFWTSEALVDCQEEGASASLIFAQAEDDHGVAGYLVLASRDAAPPSVRLAAVAPQPQMVAPGRVGIHIQTQMGELADLAPDEKLYLEVVAFDLAGNLSLDAISFTAEAGWAGPDHPEGTSTSAGGVVSTPSVPPDFLGAGPIAMDPAPEDDRPADEGVRALDETELDLGGCAHVGGVRAGAAKAHDPARSDSSRAWAALLAVVALTLARARRRGPPGPRGNRAPRRCL